MINLDCSEHYLGGPDDRAAVRCHFCGSLEVVRDQSPLEILEWRIRQLERRVTKLEKELYVINPNLV